MSKPKSWLILALLCTVTTAHGAQGTAKPAVSGTGKVNSSGFYCCDGGRICSDTLPEQCRGKAYQVLDSAGNPIKEVGPPLTPEQKAQIAAEAARKKELEEQQREQRRKDQALLVTYASPQDIDMAQKKAEEDVNFAIRAAEERISAAQKKRNKLLEEAEFYKKKPMPGELAKSLRDVEHEIKTEQELMEVKRGDAATIKAKYDADRKRYTELTGRSTAPAPLSTPSPSAAPPGSGNASPKR